MCRSTATEYRLKASAKQKRQKKTFAELNDADGIITCVPVWDVDTHKIHYYWHEGLFGGDVRQGPKAGWHFAGTVDVPEHLRWYRKKEGEEE
jgi:hypothetical protein